MDSQAFLSKLEEMLEREPGTLGAGTLLEEAGWDSLAVVSFLALADEQFGTVLRPRDVNGCKTVADLAALFGDKITA